ncbi:hypothetical protein CPAV1605_751 [seawater metagenome]|uniref:Uncharacterized protein n=1 Tax=seawater metagenome TaxID=1561972 RepID=A0A5E8CIU6_9ZZZZ
MSGIEINKNYPNLYKYLYLCIIEQRGEHALVDYSKQPKDMVEDDIFLIKEFIKLFHTEFCESSEIIKNFLNEFNNVSRDELETHITRDCQIIETGNHYITFSFKQTKENYINSISFNSKFKQSMGSLPEGDEKITAMLTIDYKDTSKKTNHVIFFDNQKYQRERIFCENINIENKMISELPAYYLLPDFHNLKPKLNPDSCLVS